jgi:anti-sigma B factor antagonist
VDLTGLAFFGSSGISVLLQAHKRCQAQRTSLRVVATTQAVLRALSICGLDSVLDIQESLATTTRVQFG